MRVIGGEAGGRRLVAPALPGLRPTSDRVREAMFDILEARGLVEGADVLDLFAGSGALGIEALSRGAASCTFVELDRRAAEAVEANLAATGLGDEPGVREVRVVRADVLAWLPASGVSGGVALVDPPYRFSGWDELLSLLPVDVAVLEHDGRLEVVPPFETIRSYKYGGTLVTLVTRTSTDKDHA